MERIKDRVRQNEQVTRITLKRLLKYSDEELNTMAFDGAYEYMRKIFGTEEHFPLTTEFWAWWRREWASIDAAFVDALRLFGPNEIHIRDRDEPNKYTYLVNGLAELRTWYAHYHEATVDNRHVRKDVVDAVRKAIIYNIKVKVS